MYFIYQHLETTQSETESLTSNTQSMSTAATLIQLYGRTMEKEAYYLSENNALSTVWAPRCFIHECFDVVSFYFENPRDTEMLLLRKPYKLASVHLLAVL